MRVLITGKNGQIARALKLAYQNSNHEILNIGRPEIDFANPIALNKEILALRPDILISVAAFTAVDDAEHQSEIAQYVNCLAPQIMARACNDLAIPIIHISTEFVFSGEKITPYIESDEAKPINKYGQSKLAGEIAIASECKDHVILRTSWIFSEIGKNFVKSILNARRNGEAINVVNDQIGSPNNAHDLAQAIIAIVEKIKSDKSPDLRGIFHFSGHNYINRAEFAKKIYEIAAKFGYLVPRVNEIDSSQFPLPAKRPKNSCLNCQKLKQVYDIEVTDWNKDFENIIFKILNEEGAK